MGIQKFSIKWFASVVGFQSIDNPALQLYPNPGAEAIQILGIDKATLARVYSSSGNFLWEQQLHPDQQQIDTHQLTAGIYFIQIGTQTIKWVKAED